MEISTRIFVIICMIVTYPFLLVYAVAKTISEFTIVYFSGAYSIAKGIDPDKESV